ncbi:methyl-accepting chemotaxis protein [Sphingomonas parva]|uniref:Methyl-accepting chemotaxis protein n=1 Tax=Sphingomonas parva TaxID=2555898 RepID=A0A4Y8ZNN5_9SPHN|nr:methyl-accepting chemotaxis protein [Sphingomonas parva]TFI57633.1 methyl-accepting chemotaxis protein [Sphingomonas parva]
MTVTSLDSLRSIGMRLICGAICALAVVNSLAASAGDGKWPAALVSLLLCLYPFSVLRSGDTGGTARVVTSLTVTGMPAITLYAFEGFAWQTDLHMIFFAALATTVILCDWRAIIVGTAAVAVHHLLLGMLLPGWVFLGDGSLFRIVMHAVILLAQAGVLIFTGQQIASLIDRLQAESVERAATEAAAAAEREEGARAVLFVTDRMAASLAAVRDGDLTAGIEDPFPAAYEPLKANFNAMLDGVRELVMSIARATENIRGGSDEISRAAGDLSRRTEQQAATLEQTAAAMTQVTATVQSSSRGAGEANRLVQAMQAEAQSSTKTVTDAVAAMAEIEKSSQEITKIISVIERIAFQTNLLALNASVEAAQAGEAGRAFTVVANEVRALAQRSADAAQEIGQLITNSSRQVDDGVAMVGEAGKALGRIIGSVDEISGLVSQIAKAADQQGSALGQVNIAIAEMDKVTQQNALMVEESNAAAGSLADEATGLARMVDGFKTGAVAGLPISGRRAA